MPSGILLIDKPLGMRSATCVGRLRALLGKGTRVGHAGTLDSTASGLLVLLVGAATRASDYVMMLPKLYRARVRLGEATDTCDHSGRVLHRGDASRVSAGDVDRVLLSFLGWRMQRPPEISALKLRGRPSHRLARAGLDVPLQPRAVFVRSIRRTSALEAGCFDVEVLCGKGTYVRSIARDIGDRLGCGACIESLRRLSTGGFHVDAALSPDRAEVLLREGCLKLQPLSTVSRLFHRVELSGAAEATLLHGLPVPLAEATLGDSDWATPELVREHADAALAAASRPLCQLQGTMHLSDPQAPRMGSMWPGDLVDVDLCGHPSMPDGTYRMRLMEMSGDSGDDVELTFDAIEDPWYAREVPYR